MIAPSNGNGNGSGNTRKTDHLWKPGQSGNPSGRPKGPSIASLLREVLKEDGAEVFKARARKLLESPDSEANTVKIMELFRKAIDGDKLTVAEVESIEWSVDAEESSPVPAALETNRLPQRGEV